MKRDNKREIVINIVDDEEDQTEVILEQESVASSHKLYLENHSCVEEESTTHLKKMLSTQNFDFVNNKRD